MIGWAVYIVRRQCTVDRLNGWKRSPRKETKVAHEDFIKLIERVLEDPDFRQRVEAIKNGTQEEMMDELITIAADDGLVFTEEEVDELFRMHVASTPDDVTVELSEEELAMVAGGVGGNPQMVMSFNLQYLQLQGKFQHDNRQFGMISNIMRTRHETAKNAIGNVR
jgi:predicted ribosomally synthesized peptide with nif11-like leader